MKEIFVIYNRAYFYYTGEHILKSNTIIRKIFWFLTILYMAFIFYMSSRPIELSRQDSAWLMSAINIVESEEQAMDVNNTQMMNLQNIIRKNAHLIIFAGLGILYYISLYGYAGKFLKTASISIVLTSIFAATDEIHQIFSNRGSSVSDFMLDTLGGLIGALFIGIIFYLIDNKNIFKNFFSKIYDFDPR